MRRLRDLGTGTWSLALALMGLCGYFAAAQGPLNPSLPAPPPGAQLLQPPTVDGPPLFWQCCAPSCCCCCDPPPPMMGDFYGYCAMHAVPTTVLQTVTITTSTVRSGGGPLVTTKTTTSPVARNLQVCDAVAGRGMYKIGVNESPMPQNRVFLRYDFTDNLSGTATPIAPTSSTTTVKVGATTTTTTTTTTGATSARNIDVHSELFGVEQTFNNGLASIGLRVPVFQQNGDGSIGSNGFGDLTVILKHILWQDSDMGGLISGGLAVTAPTGPGIPTFAGELNSVLLQPYIGHMWAFGDFLVQGFSSVIVPTDASDVTLLYNSLGVNYTVFRGSRDQWITYIAPTVEAHVTTPLNHRGDIEPLIVPDIVSLTAGVHIGLGQRSVLALGINTPITGPKPYDLGVIVQLNVRY